MNSDERESLQLALLKLETMQNQLSGLRDILLSLAKDANHSTRLTIPWIGQNTARTDDDFTNNDCGPAVLTMWLNWLGHVVTVDDVSAATGLSRNYKSTTYAHLIKAAAAYGLTLERVTSLTLDAIRFEIDHESPMIVLVHYPSLAVRFDANYKSGHWLLVTGYDDFGFFYNDSYWPDARGESIYLESAAFEQAMMDCIIDGNTPNQGIRLK